MFFCFAVTQHATVIWISLRNLGQLCMRPFRNETKKPAGQKAFGRPRPPARILYLGYRQTFFCLTGSMPAKSIRQGRDKLCTICRHCRSACPVRDLLFSSSSLLERQALLRRRASALQHYYRKLCAANCDRRAAVDCSSTARQTERSRWTEQPNERGDAVRSREAAFVGAASFGEEREGSPGNWEVEVEHARAHSWWAMRNFCHTCVIPCIYTVEIGRVYHTVHRVEM